MTQNKMLLFQLASLKKNKTNIAIKVKDSKEQKPQISTESHYPVRKIAKTIFSVNLNKYSSPSLNTCPSCWDQVNTLE